MSWSLLCSGCIFLYLLNSLHKKNIVQNADWALSVSTKNANMALRKCRPLFYISQTIALWTNVSSNHDGCVQRTSRFPQQEHQQQGIKKLIICVSQHRASTDQQDVKATILDWSSQMRRSVCKRASNRPTDILQYAQNRPWNSFNPSRWGGESLSNPHPKPWKGPFKNFFVNSHVSEEFWFERSYQNILHFRVTFLPHAFSE